MNFEPSMTLYLIVATVVVSLLAWQNPRWLHAMIHHPPSVQRGQYWRLVTHGFIHADGTHLAFNMITLFFFGMAMERVLVPEIGMGGFVLFYLAAIVLASLPSHLRHLRDPSYRSLGASGAVSAVLFAYILLQPWSLLFVFFIPVPAIVFAAVYVGYSLYAQRQNRDNINHSAHLWGGAWGVAFMLWLEPGLLARFFHELLAPLG
ncbi:rhomboid family intramembrane serine protease [Thioalkalivibrio sp. ALE17]|uniref:rhomboid family intramembrane serine protease n=1 Tax=Thioalkalivibrio sp. ALE17 TaxID=1158173 RepID=UPI00041B6AA0|nr:rhomboid family intramembrane serine protease [Thioalkalivibrio sp. ALE17]